MSLGDKIQRRRRKLGLNQKQLADVSGITQATISRIESGKVKELKSQALKRLAKVLGVTVDYLVDRTDKLTPTDIIHSDITAKYIFRGYEKLGSVGRKQLKDFVHFLEKQEEKK